MGSKVEKTNENPEGPTAVASEVGETTHLSKATHDEVFGELTEDGPNFRNVGWLGTSVLMMKCQIGLGVLSIPAAFDILGMVPGIICMLTIAILTTWGSYVVGTFKLNHREVYGIDDAVGIMFGRVGREVFGVCFVLFLVFAAASGMLGISISFNAVSTHGACTAVFVAVAAIIAMFLASLRTLDRISFIAWAGLVSILVSILIVTIAVGVQDRPDEAPDGPWSSDWKTVGNPTFTEAISAISTFIFAYVGTPFYFPIVAEMRDPRHYAKSMLLCQTIVTVTYITIGVVVYYYCGSFVASPALGSAGKLLKQISYGIALPGLIASSTLSTHFASKWFFVRILRQSKHLAGNTFTHWATWFGCVFSVGVVAYTIASGIPIFGGLVALIGALLGTLMCFQPLGCMWLYDNWKGGEVQSLKWVLLVALNVFIIVSGTFLMIAGTYGSITGIIASYKADGGSRAWSCADNSNSV
ncbi:neutral amino acid transporter [Verticillium alfalfae VaMs.102]|uniref:Neutral amino acid transporter n=1 Tax=Verticillium alfalfae (strain VaMs.102 / ATCC MYA-4576 / FGSC 10136) TaxID=526221 RepID=C9SEI3_VERA1|nr:neutral amino acid transporter [Verticillium alfalfae VaMs.102]EEY16576.1 neutral amino acid transporter [Verticillium alfalfae VaMs.102]